MSHQRKSPPITEKGQHTLDEIRAALKSNKTAGELRGLGGIIRHRLGEIDARLRELKAPTNPGTGGRAYLEALASGSPADLQALSDERELLEAERKQLSTAGKQIADARKRAEVRESFQHVGDLDGLCDQAEQALAAYQEAVRALSAKKSRIAQSRNLGDRLGEPVPEAAPELAVRCARLLVSDARGENSNRVRALRDLGVVPSRHLVAEAGKAPGESIQAEPAKKSKAAAESAAERAAGVVN